MNNKIDYFHTINIFVQEADLRIYTQIVNIMDRMEAFHVKVIKDPRKSQFASLKTILDDTDADV